MEELNREFVIYPLSSRMKALGFDEPCLAWFVSEEHGLEIGAVVKSDLIKEGILAPTWQTAFKWFREKYGLYFNIHRLEHKIGTKEEFMLTIDAPLRGGYYKTYEEAELVCLEKLIEIAESK